MVSSSYQTFFRIVSARKKRLIAKSLLFSKGLHHCLMYNRSAPYLLLYPARFTSSRLFRRRSSTFRPFLKL